MELDTLKCPQCKERYNREYNRPIEMMCGDTVCEVCFTDSRNQKKTEYTCPFDKTTYPVPEKVTFNKRIARLLKYFAQTNIVCKKHDAQCNYFCNQHKEMCCYYCLIEKHQDHPELIQEFSQSSIQKFFDISSQMLQKVLSEVQQLLQIAAKHKNLKFSEQESTLFFQNFDKIDKFIQKTASNEEEKEKHKQTLFFQKFQGKIKSIDVLKKEEEEQYKKRQEKQKKLMEEMKEKQEKDQQAREEVKLPDSFNHFMDSAIATTPKDKLILAKWMKGEGMVYSEKIYDSSIDGIDPKAFFKKCAKQTKIALLFENDLKKKFGAYLTTPFKEPKGDALNPYDDNKSFIFQLQNMKKLTGKPFGSAYSIQRDSVITFGNNTLFTGLKIGNKGELCSCNLGGDKGQFKLPKECAGVDGDDLLCGGKSFTVTKMEVYKIHKTTKEVVQKQQQQLQQQQMQQQNQSTTHNQSKLPTQLEQVEERKSEEVRSMSNASMSFDSKYEEEKKGY